MATGFFFKSSDDAGAPQLTNVAGSLIAILDWALDVANPASHWAKIHSGTNKAAYQAKTGQRQVLFVDDSIGDRAYVRGYGNMSDINTGVDPFPTVAQRANNGFFCYKANNAVAKTWRIVGDSRYFALLPSAQGNQYVYKLIFGETTPYDAVDTFATVIIASMATGITYRGDVSGALFSGALDHIAADYYPGGIYFARTIDGISVSSAGWLQHCGGAGAVISSNYNGAGALPRAPVPVYNQIRLWDQNYGDKLTETFVRSVLPYIYAMPYSFDANIYPLDSTVQAGSSSFRVYAGMDMTGLIALLRITDDEPGRV